MRAALYVRVSTDEQSQSAETQETEARRYCDRHGWTVADVYRDVGASGAEWQTRPEIARLLVDVVAHPRPWDVVVVRDQDRIGRDMGRTVLAIEKMLNAGARVIEYSTGREATSDPLARAQLAPPGRR